MMAFDITNMLTPEVFDHPVSHIELIETHISWVLLTGEFAYKIKKPVNFVFLDFSTLEKRHECCEQELRLNRRLAARIYLEVVSITGTPSRPQVSGDGDIFEYAVKMRQFPQSVQLDNMLAAEKLTADHIDAIARMVARFHQTTEVSDDSMDFGNKQMVYQPVEENFSQIKENLDNGLHTDKLDLLAKWCSAEFSRLEAVFEQRKHDGFIRECHGDMHLRNLVWYENQAMAFDCIEFNSALRWIDVISEVAFLVMDLQDRKQPILANRFLNTYLEISGDYEGLSVLPFYLCYRALVRAKVNTLRLAQKDLSMAERKNTLTELDSYLELALTYTEQTKPKLIIMRGLSASGKSTVSQQLLEKMGAIRIRSDVERKRLFDTLSTDNNLDNKKPNEVDSGIYTKNASQQTYAKLAELASAVIDAGYDVIVDAAFLMHEQRESFQALAKRLTVPYIIIELNASAECLRQRISKRQHDVSDADLTILEHQLSNWQPLHEDETGRAIFVNTEEALEINRLIDTINTI